MEIARKDYLDLLSASRDMPRTVKVLIGMRRTGKTTIMNQFMRIITDDTDEGNIFHIDLDLAFDKISVEELRNMMQPVLDAKGMHYIFLDEIQNVDEWERLVAMLVARGDCDIYITGSSSKMLSSELSTKLSGRYIEIEVFPFSFKEYMELRPGDRTERFSEYLRYGAIPAVDPDRGEVMCRHQLEGIYNTVMMKDVLTHINGEARRLKAISRFLFSNIANMTSTHSIAVGTSIPDETVGRYIDAMTSAFLFHHAERYDIVGKKVFDSKGKYYATDLGIRHTILNDTETIDISRPIENIVYLELLRRGKRVYVGSYRDKEVDFTAFDADGVEYYQVTQSMMDETTRERETSSLMKIDDNFPKTVLTLDVFGLGTYNGIKVVNLIDWLLDRCAL